MADAIAPSAVVSSSESSPEIYGRLLPKIMSVEGPFPHINVDVMVVVTSILGRMKQIEAMSEVLISKLKDFDPQLIAHLDDYARALQHAHGLYLQATKSPAALQTLVDQATQMRDMLFADAGALAQRGLLNPDAFREVKKNNGYRSLIVDLQVLVATFRERWETVKDKTAVRAEELDRSVTLVDTLTEAVGVKEYSPAAQAQATQIRQKAFTLVTRTYDEIRSALIYARREEGDADTIAPSLYIGRSTGSKRGDVADENADEANTTTPPNTPQVPPAPQPGLTASLTANGPFQRTSTEA